MENRTQLFDGAKLLLTCTSGPNVWETANGAIMVELSFKTEGEPIEHITDSQCLVQKDGTVSDITMRTLKSCFEWDGVNPFEIPSEGKQIEATIAHESYQNENNEDKVAIKIKYMNPPGGGRHIPADQAKVMAKYGAVFRALSGGTPAQRPKPQATKPAQPAMPKPGNQSTSEDAWAAACAKHPDLASGGKEGEDKLSQIWTEAIQKLGKPVDKFNGADWAKVKESFA